MAAVDDLMELVERAAAAEKSALASKWKDEALRSGADQQNAQGRRGPTAGGEPGHPPDRLSPRWAGLRQNYLDLGAQPALPGQEPSTQEGPGEKRGDTGETVPRRLSRR